MGYPEHKLARVRLRHAMVITGFVAVAMLASVSPRPRALAGEGKQRTYQVGEHRIKSNAPAAVAKQVGARIGRFGEVFQAFFDDLDMKARRKNKIVARVFATREGYVRFRNRDVGDKGWTAYWSPSLNAMVLYVDDADITLKHILFHETFHQYFSRYTAHAPKWLNEGLAEYFEGWRIEPELEERVQLYDLIVLQTALRKNRYVTPKRMVAMSRDAFDDFSERNPKMPSLLHYSTSWGLVYYCMKTTHEPDRERLRTYLTALNGKGEKGARAQFQVDDWAAFEERWKTFILAIEPKIETLTDHMLVGRGYRSDKQWKLATKIYESALALDETAPGVHYYLGLCLKKRGMYAEARVSLEKAREIEQANPRACYQLSRIHAGVDRKNEPTDLEKALAYAREAFARSGEAGAHYLYMVARCQALAGDPKSAVKTMRKVVKLADDDDVEWYEEKLDEFREQSK